MYSAILKNMKSDTAAKVMQLHEEIQKRDKLWGSPTAANVENVQLRCTKCRKVRKTPDFCAECMRNRLRSCQWTSGKEEIDTLIRRSQEDPSISSPSQIIEWVQADEFVDVEHIAKGGFGSVYSAIWQCGCIGEYDGWDPKSLSFQRIPNRKVVLKTVSCQKKLSNFLVEIDNHRKLVKRGWIAPCFGVTKHPSTGEYAMVMSHFDDGDLRKYLRTHYSSLTLLHKLNMIRQVTNGLRGIHVTGLCHRDLHSGNILCHKTKLFVADLGLSGPSETCETDTDKTIFGVMPYMAPEVLWNAKFSEKSDVYSLGMIIWEVMTGHQAFRSYPHDRGLAQDICNGLRPTIPDDVPHWLADLLLQCWAANPLERPDARSVGLSVNEAIDILKAQNVGITTSSNRGFLSQLKNYPTAVFHSRIFDFESLPKPKDASPEQEFHTSKISYQWEIDNFGLTLDDALS